MCLSPSTLILFNDSTIKKHGGYSGGVRSHQDIDSLAEYVRMVGTQYGWDEIERICLAAYQIIKNHIFWDGNKRTAMLTIQNCLRELGYSFTGRPKDLASKLITMAAAPANEKEESVLGLAYFIRSHLQKR